MTNTIRPQINGPLMISGDIELVTEDGVTVFGAGNKIWLCRCGRSSNKPYCDSSHRKTGFSDGATVSAEYKIKRPEPGEPGSRLRLTPRRDGPLHCFGSMKILGSEGSKWNGDQANLCRCGQSGNKPFCDGSHRQFGFATG